MAVSNLSLLDLLEKETGRKLHFTQTDKGTFAVVDRPDPYCYITWNELRRASEDDGFCRKLAKRRAAAIPPAE